MTLNEAAIKAEIILIDGDRGAGKNTLAIHFLSLFGQEDQSAAIVTIPKEIYQKKQEIYKNMTDTIGYPFQNIFFLSDEWRVSKKKFGFRFLINDIEKILDTTQAKILYFQRLDELFDITDQMASFEIVSDIARLALSRNVKLIVSVLKSSDNYTTIKDMLIDYADLTVSINSDNDRNGRIVQVVSSFYPIAAALYQFVFSDRHFTLQEKNFPSKEPVISSASVYNLEETTQSPHEKKIINLVIISQNHTIINWSAYLFGNLARVSLKFFRNFSELTPEIWEQCDAAVYSSDAIEPIFEFCSFTRQISKTVKIFGWFTQGYIRTEDRVKAHQLGCHDIFGPTTRLVDYILSLEKSLHIPFYSESIDYKKQSEIVIAFTDFIDLVEEALRVRRIFTIFIFRYSIPYNGEMVENLFREEDVAYFDEENRIVYLLFMNAQKSDREILGQKLLRIKSDVVFEKSIEAPDLFGGKEVLKDSVLLSSDRG